jgi:hypothetical protein
MASPFRVRREVFIHFYFFFRAIIDKLLAVKMHISMRRILIMIWLGGMPGLLGAAEDLYGRPPFAVPPRLGTITDYWRPTKGAQPLHLENESIVVMIQDLHANVGVQKNIAATLYRLDRLNRDRGLLVCVEGASGEGDVSLLRSLPGPIRHGFEELLLRRAYLTGAELAATESAADVYQQGNVLWSRLKSYFVQPSGPAPVSISPIHLWGVDDPKHYRKNWHAAKQVDKMSRDALNYVRTTKSFLLEGAGGSLQKHLGLLTKLIMLRLQPDEYKAYLQGRAMNPKGPPVYQQTVAAAEAYYLAADQRSTAMANNLLDRMKQTPGITVLITGGFHTREIADILKHKGISIAVVTPRVEVLDQDQAYKARLREEE